MYVYLSSKCSSQYFEDNSSSHFTSLLPQNLILEGEWEVALIQLQYPKSDKNTAVIIQTDVAADIVFENNMLPVIKHVNLSSKGKFQTFNYPYYVTVRRSHVDKINIHITDLQGKNHSFNNSEPVRCTLHFRKCQPT